MIFSDVTHDFGASVRVRFCKCLRQDSGPLVHSPKSGKNKTKKKPKPLNQNSVSAFSWTWNCVLAIGLVVLCNSTCVPIHLNERIVTVPGSLLLFQQQGCQLATSNVGCITHFLSLRGSELLAWEACDASAFCRSNCSPFVCHLPLLF